jgi:hypothetical protein
LHELLDTQFGEAQPGKSERTADSHPMHEEEVFGRQPDTLLSADGCGGLGVKEKELQ